MVFFFTIIGLAIVLLPRYNNCFAVFDLNLVNALLKVFFFCNGAFLVSIEALDMSLMF